MNVRSHPERNTDQDALVIQSVKAFPLSFPLSPEHVIRRGIGTPVKRDCIVVKVTAKCGLVGYGEAHHGRSPSAVAELINTSISQLVTGMDGMAISECWRAVQKRQLASHGMGAGSYIALSGLDMALWDLKAKYLGLPAYKLMGGQKKPIKAYAGGVSLGFKEDDALLEEVAQLRARGFRAIKLRFGDTPQKDINRLKIIRARHEDLAIMVDANSTYTLEDFIPIAGALHECRVTWLEEPFPAYESRNYAEARRRLQIPLAAGENHYGRPEFARLVEERCVDIIQPDLSKSGGPTEILRIAHLVSGWGLLIHPHTSATGLNQAAALHVLSAIDNPGYYEFDAAVQNPFRDVLCSPAIELDENGCVTISDAPGFGVVVHEDMFPEFPIIGGPGFI